MATLTPNLNLVKPSGSDNVNIESLNSNFDILDSEISGLKTDYVVAQGTSGIWQYRRWASGIGECWIEAYKVTSFDVTGTWAGIALYTGVLSSPGAYPFQFKNIPMVIPTWASTSLYSSPIWAKPGTGSLSSCPQFQVIDPTRGTKASAVLSIYVKGTWK